MTDNPTPVPPTGRLHLGAAYYPEHWPEERWPTDIRLMAEAGFTVARLAEFAWSTLEPAAGQFQLDWLDRAIGLLAEAGLDSVLGTPTAAPPAWLAQKYPDMLAVDETSRRVQFGNRCHYCVTSPEFHEAARRVVTAMAERFGPQPRVIGWQVDNEYNRVCYCDRCRDRFQQYLREKFGSLDALNAHWSTAYWSQTYSDWAQIPLPIGPHNPGLLLAFKQFVTDCYRRFQQLQLDALRPHLPPQVWVTHNFMGWYDGFDHYPLAADLDLASWDWYIGTGHHNHLVTGAIHDLTRGFKRKNFWVMETQPGSVNWSPLNNMLNKGEGRAMVWHAIGHGADAVLYWQWRSALGGQEQYHGSLVDQSGQPRPFYTEVQRLGREFKKVSNLLASTTVKAQVAILNDYNSRWSIQWQRHHQDFDYVKHLTHYYQPLAALNIPVDIISADADLSGYRLVIAPAMLLVNEQRAESFKNYAKGGGHLVLTARCGLKDGYNALLPARQPSLLAELAGVEVEEYYALDEPAPVKGNWFGGHSQQWAELLKITDTKTGTKIATYGPSNGWLDDKTAITVHAYGASGLVYYVGAYLDEAAQFAMLKQFTETAGINRPPFETPAGVEVCARQTAAKTDIWIMINHYPLDQIISLTEPLREHLSGKILANKFKLTPYDVAILTKEDAPTQ